MMRCRSRVDRDETGLSLIELIVTVVVIGLVFMTLAGIFANIVATQGNVTRQSDGTVRGQQFASSIERAMRDAVAFAPTANTLTVEVPVAGGDTECRIFSAATADVHIEDLVFSAKGVGGIHYSFRAVGGPASDSTNPGAAPPLFEGDAFARNSAGGTPSC